MTTAQMQETCGDGDCRRPVLARGLCQTHYERGRERHRHREYGTDRAAQTRARNRATAALVKRHKAEFDLLLAAELEQAQAQVVELEEHAEQRGIARERGVARLRPGPRPVDEKPADRLREDVGRCPKCHVLHDAGHVCPACGEELVDLDLDVPRGHHGVLIDDVRHLDGFGLGPAEIAARLGVSPSTVIQCAYRTGDKRLANRLQRAVYAHTGTKSGAAS